MFNFWTATSYNAEDAWRRALTYDHSMSYHIHRGYTGKKDRLVRALRKRLIHFVPYERN
jgi:hypothetical protein